MSKVRIDRDTLSLLLQSSDEREVCRALVAAALHDPDWRWVQSQCVRFATHSSSWVRRVIPTCFGHLARIRRQNERDLVERVLDRLAEDPFAEVRGTVQDARDDFAIFLDRAQTQ